MLRAEQNWDIFGYDVRLLGRQWLAAWRALLWAPDAPLREYLDEVVCVRDGDSTRLYQAGRVSAEAPYVCEAILLPQELVLARRLQLPLSAESELDAVMALETRANSPFSTDDTGYGWRIVSRDESHLHLLLVMVSRSAVMAHLGKTCDIHDARERECWAAFDEGMVVLKGFGEDSRDQRYRKRLQRCGLMLAVCALVILVMAAVAAGSKRTELFQVEAQVDQAQRDAAQASGMREALALANETIGSANRIVALYPNPHFELARLSALLDDDTYISQFTMVGRDIQLRGRALDAASVMEKLTDHPAYAEVSAPQAIGRVAGSSVEQFSLNIRLRAERASG